MEASKKGILFFRYLPYFEVPGGLYLAFILTAPPPERKTLASSGLRPQEHSYDELEDLGMLVFSLPCMGYSEDSNTSFQQRIHAEPNNATNCPVLLLPHRLSSATYANIFCAVYGARSRGSLGRVTRTWMYISHATMGREPLVPHPLEASRHGRIRPIERGQSR